MNFHDALKKLHHARKRLVAEQGRIARRNARRAVLGSLQSLRNALDLEYPALARPRPPKPDKPIIVKVKKAPLRLERHRFSIAHAQLFVDLVGDVLGWQYDLGAKVMWENTIEASTRPHVCYINPRQSDQKQWRQVVTYLNIILGHVEVSDLYHQFWRELLPVGDLELAARHQEFLEKHGVKELPK